MGLATYNTAGIIKLDNFQLIYVVINDKAHCSELLQFVEAQTIEVQKSLILRVVR